MINKLPEVIERKKVEWNRPNLRQKDIAQEAEVDPGTLSRYINDRVDNFNRSVVEKLCQYFNVGIEELFFIERDNPN